MASVAPKSAENGNSRLSRATGNIANGNGHMPPKPVKPAPDHIVVDEKSPPIVYERDNAVGPGLMREDLYESQMGSWRAGIRRILVRNLVKESEWLARMQARFLVVLYFHLV